MCRTKQGAQAQFGSGQCFSDLSGAWKYRSGQSTPAWGARIYALALDLAFDGDTVSYASTCIRLHFLATALTCCLAPNTTQGSHLHSYSIPICAILIFGSLARSLI